MRTVLIGLGVAAMALGAGCKKSGPGGVGGAAAGATGTAMDRLPKETSFVVGFSWTKFKDSKLFTMLQGAMPEESKAEMQAFKDACQIDPMSDVDSMVIAGGGNMDKDRMLILVKGKWDEAKIGNCAVKYGEKKGKKVTTAKDGAITTYTAEGEQPIHVAWQGDTAILTPAAMEGDKTYLSDLLKQTSSVKENAAFMEVLGKVDTGATIYAAMLVPPGNADMANATNKMTGGTEKLQSGWVTVKLGKDLDTSGGMRFATDAEAKAVADKMNQELEGARADATAGPYLKNLSVTQAGPEVHFKLALSEQQVDQLLEMAKQMLPMLGMMMGGGL
jgi:hypothetical protein